MSIAKSDEIKNLLVSNSELMVAVAYPHTVSRLLKDMQEKNLRREVIGIPSRLVIKCLQSLCHQCLMIVLNNGNLVYSQMKKQLDNVGYHIQHSASMQISV